MKSAQITIRAFSFRRSRPLTLMAALDGSKLPAVGGVSDGPGHTLQVVEISDENESPDERSMLEDLRQRDLQDVPEVSTSIPDAANPMRPQPPHRLPDPRRPLSRRPDDERLAVSDFEWEGGAASRPDNV